MRLNQEIVKALALSDVRQQFASFDFEPIGSSPEQMASHVNAELAKWANVVRDAKLPRATVH
jgi:tripartite-type tricarboxylate transporter receptor subunit TctC